MKVLAKSNYRGYAYSLAIDNNIIGWRVHFGAHVLTRHFSSSYTLRSALKEVYQTIDTLKEASS
jgi:hypothetical protein